MELKKIIAVFFIILTSLMIFSGCSSEGKGGSQEQETKGGQPGDSTPVAPPDYSDTLIGKSEVEGSKSSA